MIEAVGALDDRPCPPRRRSSFAQGEGGAAVVVVVVEDALDHLVVVVVDGRVVPVDAVEAARVDIADTELDFGAAACARATAWLDTIASAEV
jgi:hypothetical protein